MRVLALGSAARSRVGGPSLPRRAVLGCRPALCTVTAPGPAGGYRGLRPVAGDLLRLQRYRKPLRCLGVPENRVGETRPVTYRVVVMT